MTKKFNFILGLGAQKAGTSWLYSQLVHEKSSIKSLGKETHALSNISRLDMFKAVAIGKVQSLAEELQSAIDTNFSELNVFQLVRKMDRVRASLNMPRYVETYSMLSRWNSSDVIDFTPENSLVPVETLSAFKSQASDFFNIKTIFLMRDPIERMWSWGKHIVYRRPDTVKLEYSSPVEFLESHLERYRKGVSTFPTQSSSYHKLIPNFDRIFPDTLYLFYEDLFTEESLSKVKNYLSISDMPANFSKKVNATDGPDIPPTLYREFRSEMSETYDFLAQRFAGKLPDVYKD